MCEIKEERRVLVLGDELNRFVGVSLGQRAMVYRPLDDSIILHQGHVPVLRLRRVVGGSLVALVARHSHSHVVRVRKAEPRVEALMHRQELRKLAQMPFPHHAGPVAR